MTVQSIEDFGQSLTPRQAAPFLAWPGAAHLRYAAALALANGLWFEFVFAGCDFLTGQRSLRLRVDLPGELSIPFIAPMTAFYMSMYLLFIAGPFILRTRNEFRAAVAMLAVSIAIAGICFLLFPVELAYPPISENELGAWAPLFHLADALNLTYDLLPSLHVALTVGCVAVFATLAGGAIRVLLWIWALGVALSTVLTHQHHVLDVLTGWLLALACFRYVYKPLIGPKINLLHSEMPGETERPEPGPDRAALPNVAGVDDWQIVCLARELREKPLKVMLRNHPIVLFRGGGGLPVALEDRCAHRNAPLSLGRVCNGRLQCAYHGWEYDCDGRVARLPSLAAEAARPNVRVPKFRALEQDGFIWIASGNAIPTEDPARFAHFNEPGWSSFVMRTRFRGTIDACLENFLDCPHATFVHRFWFRSPTAKSVKAVVTTVPDGAVAEYFEEPRERSVVWSLLSPRSGSMRHTDRFIAPATSRVDYEFGNGWHYVITSSCTEVNASETDVFTVISFRCGMLTPLVRLYFEPLSRYIIRQDVKILSAQQANIARFGAPVFTSTQADLLGPHIAAWRRCLRTGENPPPAGTVTNVAMRL